MAVARWCGVIQLPRASQVPSWEKRSGEGNRSAQADHRRGGRRLGCQSVAFIAIGNTSLSIRRFIALNKCDEIKLLRLIVEKFPGM